MLTFQDFVSVLSGGFHENYKVYSKVLKGMSFITWASSYTSQTEHTLCLAIDTQVPVIRLKS